MIMFKTYFFDPIAIWQVMINVDQLKLFWRTNSTMIGLTTIFFLIILWVEKHK